MTPWFRLTHVGEPIVAAMLQNLADQGGLSELVCRAAGEGHRDETLAKGLGRIGLMPPFKFLPEEAKLRVVTPEQCHDCDGAQKVDVLCTAARGAAAAFELKLGRDGLSASRFTERFCTGCTAANGRLKGPMVSVLERKVVGVSPGFRLLALAEAGSWTVAEDWWLVMRKEVWLQYQRRKETLPLEHAAVILIEELIELFGGQACFNALVITLLGDDPFSAWRLGHDALG